MFQSAVAHELISNKQWARMQDKRAEGFKALSRMSSFPTGLVPDSAFAGLQLFQSAVAHELISNQRQKRRCHEHQIRFKALSRMSSFPTGRALRWNAFRGTVSKRCRA